jgi:hypothetical protein
MKVGDLVKHKSPGREIGIVTKISPIIGVPGGMAKVCWTGNLPALRERGIGGVRHDVLYRVENLEIINESR